MQSSHTPRCQALSLLAIERREMSWLQSVELMPAECWLDVEANLLLIAREGRWPHAESRDLAKVGVQPVAEVGRPTDRKATLFGRFHETA